jgi:hypothetical protein
MDRRTFLAAAPAVLAGCVSVGGAAGPAAPGPVNRGRVRWTYRCADGYRLPVEWMETHEVIAVDATGIAVRVTGQGGVNFQRVELLSSPGVVKIGAAYDPDETRTFDPPMTRFGFPLTPGAQWSQFLRNFNPENQLQSNINRFVKVGGYETVTTPAGTFNAITMRTLMGVDDNNPFRWPTQCNYVTWWAEAPGNVVRMTKYAEYLERGDGINAVKIRAQNTTIELASYSRAPA